MPNNMPKDLYDELTASGVTFDENGNIVDDPLFSFDVDETDEDQKDDDQTDDNDDQTDDADDNEDNEEDNGDIDNDSSDPDDDNSDTESEVTPPEQKVKPESAKKIEQAQPKFKLTHEDDNTHTKTVDTSSEIQSLKAQIERLEALLLERNTQAKADTSVDVPDEDDDPVKSIVRRLEAEREEFRMMKVRELANSLEREVNRRFADLGVNFKEITTSKEWKTYLNQRRYGQQIGNFYAQAVQSGDLDEMLMYFDEFKDMNAPAATQAPVRDSGTNKKLADLAVPDNTKATKKLKRPSKYDFTYEDFSKKLEDFERGRITPAQFDEFERKFEEAEAKGRVRPTH